MDIDWVALIGIAITAIGWGAYYLHAKKLHDEIVALFALVKTANDDGKVTQDEFNAIMDQINTVMKAGYVVVKDIESIKNQIQNLLAKKNA